MKVQNIGDNDYLIDSLSSGTIIPYVVRLALAGFDEPTVYKAIVEGLRKMASGYKERFPLVSAEYVKKADALEAGKKIEYNGIIIPVE